MLLDPKKHPNCARGHQYALDIVSKKIPASIYTIGACERYLRDLNRAPDSSFYFDWDTAEKYLRNVQNFSHVIGKWPTANIHYEPWQCWLWMCIIGFRNRETGFRRFRIAHAEVARGNSKAKWIETPVPTPDGMKKWGDIKIGSRLYDRNGNICKVIGKNEVHYPDSYEIEFSDGEKLICSDKHLWFTQSKNERNRETRHSGRSLRYTKTLNTSYESVRTAKEISKTILAGKERNHSVTNTKPVVGEKKNLPVDPYVLGYWLGNGSEASGTIHCHTNDAKNIKKLFTRRGYRPTTRTQKLDSLGHAFTASGLHQQLRTIGVLGSKRIPEEYFLSTIEDRLELVRGLLDSDGTINSAMGGQVTFTAKRKELAKGLARLLHSLGYKIHQSRFKVPKDNNFVSDTLFYRVAFYPRSKSKVFNLKRKYEKQIRFSADKHSYVGKRYVVACRKLKRKFPMFCVEVDSPDKSYLIGEGHIPTHNSAMASQAVLYFLALDNPNGNQISTVATKKDQARIVLDSSRAMAKKNPSFLKYTGVKVLAHTIVHSKSNSIVRAMSSDDSGLDGLNDVLAVCDELHAMKRDVFEVVYSGMSKRLDSLTLCITTAGRDVHSVGFSQSAYAKKVALGEVQDDQFFAVVYTLDEEDDWMDEKVWIKANPNLGVSVDITTLRAKVEKAMIVPSDIPNIKIKHMNMWIAEAKAFFDQAAWDKCADKSLRLEDFKKMQCRMGLDLASHIDITSNAIVFRKDGIYYIFDKSYLPEDTIKSSRNTLYEDCVAQGYLIKTPGAAINYDHIQKEAEELAKDYRVVECLYDAWNATETAQRLSNKIEMVKIAMNVANFSEPMKKLDGLIRSGKVRHNGSPLLRWCLGNVVAKEDHNGNVFPRKSHVNLKIDPIVAVLMAMAGWVNDDEKESAYETRGILTL